MSKVKTLKKEAPELLRVAKLAFKFIRDNPVGVEADRDALLGDLQAVIDRADPPVFDESLTTVKLTMTNATADTILTALAERASLGPDDMRVYEVFQESLRRTKQRAYAVLDLNFAVLRKLHYVLRHTKTTHQDTALQRLADKINEEGLSKNPMHILGEMGL